MGNSASKHPRSDSANSTATLRFKSKRTLKEEVLTLRRQLSQEKIDKSALTGEVYAKSSTLLAFIIKEQQLREVQHNWSAVQTSVASLRNQLVSERINAKNQIKLLELKYEAEKTELLAAIKLGEENEEKLKDVTNIQKSQLTEVLDLLDTQVDKMESNLQYTQQLENKINVNKQKYEKLREEKERLIDSLTKITSEKQKMEESVLTVTLNASRNREQVTQLSIIKEHLIAEIEALKKQNISLSDENEDMKTSLSALKSQNESLEIVIKEMEEECRILKNQLEVLESEKISMKEMEKTLEERNQRISELEDNVSTLRLIHDKLTKKISDLVENEVVDAGNKDTGGSIDTDTNANEVKVGASSVQMHNEYTAARHVDAIKPPKKSGFSFFGRRRKHSDSKSLKKTHSEKSLAALHAGKSMISIKAPRFMRKEIPQEY